MRPWIERGDEGSDKISQILRGVETSDIIKRKYYELNTFGLLYNFSDKDIKTIIDLLKKKSLLAQVEVIVYNNMIVNALTEAGKEYITSDIKLNFGLISKLADTGVTILDTLDITLYEKLKDIRFELSKQYNIPAFCICSDNLLRQIAYKKPLNAEGFIQIKGIGEKFIEKYSSQFVTEIEKFLKSE